MAFYEIETWRKKDFEILDDLFTEFLPTRKNIYIFGTGNVGMGVFYYLREMGIEISGFLQSNTDDGEENITIYNKPVFCIKKFKEMYSSQKRMEWGGVILAVSERYYDEIIPNLLFLQNDLFFMGKSKHSLVNHVRDIKLCSFHIVTHCNMACFACMAGSPVAKEYFQPIEEFERDILLFHKVIGNKDVGITVTGGEALLHPNCMEFLKLARREFANNKIRLLTNGLLLQEKDSKFWDELAENRISISFTRYPINYPKYDFIISEAKKRNIELEIQFEENNKDSCYNPLFEERLSPKWDYALCPYYNYPRVMNGRLYPCCLMPEVPHLNAHFGTNIILSPEDSLDLKTVNNYEDVMKFLHKRSPMCDYCDLRHRKVQGIWKSSKREKNEWFLKD